MAFGTVAVADLAITKGGEALQAYGYSAKADRQFCGKCGTPLFVLDHREPHLCYISLATLDAPDPAAPEFHIFYAERIRWAPAGDELPCHDGFRRAPGTA